MVRVSDHLGVHIQRQDYADAIEHIIYRDVLSIPLQLESYHQIKAQLETVGTVEHGTFSESRPVCSDDNTPLEGSLSYIVHAEQMYLRVGIGRGNQAVSVGIDVLGEEHQIAGYEPEKVLGLSERIMTELSRIRF